MVPWFHYAPIVTAIISKCSALNKGGYVDTNLRKTVSSFFKLRTGTSRKESLHTYTYLWLYGILFEDHIVITHSQVHMDVPAKLCVLSLSSLSSWRWARSSIFLWWDFATPGTSLWTTSCYIDASPSLLFKRIFFGLSPCERLFFFFERRKKKQEVALKPKNWRLRSVLQKGTLTNCF